MFYRRVILFDELVEFRKSDSSLWFHVCLLLVQSRNFISSVEVQTKLTTRERWDNRSWKTKAQNGTMSLTRSQRQTTAQTKGGCN